MRRKRRKLTDAEKSAVMLEYVATPKHAGEGAAPR